MCRLSSLSLRCNVPEPSDQIVPVLLGERSYDIVIASGKLPQAGNIVRACLEKRFGTGRSSALIVTDQNVKAHAGTVQRSLQAAEFATEMAVLPAGENTKSLTVISGLYDRMVAMKADRRTAVVAVGGGVIGDAAGFLAATYNRGVPFMQIPSTLLADVDSSVGGKVGINHPQAKNLIGSFYQPIGVFIETDLLSTLPAREYRSGLAEVIKYGIILDADFFEWLEGNTSGINSRDSAVLRHIIARSCQLKADVVQQDEYERTGLRAMLNYGHTFAHAFEALCGYGELLHGEAVSIGMHYAAHLAVRRKLASEELLARQERLIQAVGLPIRLPHPEMLPADQIISRMQLDKKTVGGQLRFILPTRIGHVETVRDIPEADVRAVIADMQRSA